MTAAPPAPPYRPLVTAQDFSLCIPAHLLGHPAAVRVVADVPLAVTELVAHDGCWTVTCPRPGVDRLEYQMQRFGGSTADTEIPDPSNPRVLPNPFGDRSELRFPDYRAPGWLTRPITGRVRQVRSGTSMWAPNDLEDHVAAPMLVVHDGTDFVARGSLLNWATARAAAAPFRLLLLDPWPDRRAECYAANEEYGRSLAHEIIPAACHFVSTSMVVGWGASLGALALLDVHRRFPQVLQALVVQSGSFFTRELDPQEGAWAFFGHVCEAVEEIEKYGVRPLPVALTCGTAEENLANNQRMAATLTGFGADVTVHLIRDGHTMVGFRDAWSPAVDDLLGRCPG